MSFNRKAALLIGIVIFLYSLAAQNFWPNLNMYLNAFFAAILGGATAQIAEMVFQEEN